MMKLCVLKMQQRTFVCVSDINLILLAAVFNCRTPMAIHPSAEPPHKPQAFVHL